MAKRGLTLVEFGGGLAERICMSGALLQNIMGNRHFVAVSGSIYVIGGISCYFISFKTV